MRKSASLPLSTVSLPHTGLPSPSPLPHQISFHHHTGAHLQFGPLFQEVSLPAPAHHSNSAESCQMLCLHHPFATLSQIALSQGLLFLHLILTKGREATGGSYFYLTLALHHLHLDRKSLRTDSLRAFLYTYYLSPLIPPSVKWAQ